MAKKSQCNIRIEPEDKAKIKEIAIKDDVYEKDVLSKALKKFFKEWDAEQGNK